MRTSNCLNNKDNRIMNQTERRIYLIKYLLDEMHVELNIPKDTNEQRRLLRALFNVRLPKEIDEEFLKIQDEYLKERIEEKGITDIDILNEIQKQIYLWKGDITTLRCDCIVNAANSQMLGCFCPNHGCIDNAIHTYAGIQLRNECNMQMNKESRDILITDAYNLPSSKIIHVVGPIIQDVVREEDIQHLRSCYRRSLELAEKNGMKSIAFCCISTGEFHFPNGLACEIAIQIVQKYLKETKSGMKVIFNVFKEEDYELYRTMLNNQTDN